MLPGGTLAPDKFETLARWIYQCVSSHSWCRSITRDFDVGSQYPKRILDLTNGLVILQESIPVQLYACLSHCWDDSSNVIKTTVNTLDEYKFEISWNRVTKTFRDANRHMPPVRNLLLMD